jgi:hypothetical protein
MRADRSLISFVMVTAVLLATRVAHAQQVVDVNPDFKNPTSLPAAKAVATTPPDQLRFTRCEGNLVDRPVAASKRDAFDGYLAARCATPSTPRDHAITPPRAPEPGDTVVLRRTATSVGRSSSATWPAACSPTASRRMQ